MSKRLIRLREDEGKKATLINFILDETGSMYECLKSTISGFNEYVDTLKHEAQEKASPIRMSLTKFNSLKVDVVYTAKKIDEVPHLTLETYQPNALTPLFDAIAETVKFVDVELKEKKKFKILCVIMTDGQENASRKFNKTTISELIKNKEEEGWSFVFLGANQDAWEAGGEIGIAQGNIATYTASNVGYGAAFNTLAVDTMKYSSSSFHGATRSFVANADNYLPKDEDVWPQNQKAKKKIKK